MDTTTQPKPPTQPLRLVGGEVFDAEALTLADVTVVDGTVATVDATLPDRASEFDVAGCIVAPGFVDLHTHVFRGQRHSVDARSFGPASGSTTVVDAGSAGSLYIGAFRITTFEDDAGPRVRAFLNISAIGTAVEFQGELRGLAFCDEQAALEAVAANSDFVVGVKVRASADVGGSDVVEALGRARRVADASGLPLMCHLGPAPVTLGDILAQLREGDVLTHCFTGFGDNHVARSRQTLEALGEAVSRGVILDVGHGQSGFSFRVASAALEAGIPPTTISTDLHRGSIDALGGLPTVMSKFMALGLSTSEVLSRVTHAPARVIGLDGQGVGTLQPGLAGDIVVLRVLEGEETLTDAFGGTMVAHRSVRPVLTIQRGRIVFDDGSLPRDVG